MRRGILPVILVGSLVPGVAGATYSIVATDQATSYVGGAGTSCVGSLGVVVILGTAPNIGAVHAQAQLNYAGRDRAVELLEQGESPEDIITAITAPAFDPMASLTSALVIEQTENGFLTGGGCDMADRLMLALEAGAENGEGDSRCTPDGIPSDSAFLRVVDETGADIVFVEAINTAPESPLIELREKYDAWREQNPCEDDPGTDTGTDTGTTGATGTGTGSSGGTETDDGGSGSSSSGGTGSDDGGSDSSSSGGDDGGDTEGESSAGGDDDDDEGCGCRTDGRAGVVALLPVLIVLCRRRRARA
jgi:uncharacterized Ntn-hydrolase superfamily protein